MSELIKGSLRSVVVDGDVPIDNRIHETMRRKKQSEDGKSTKSTGTDFVVDMEDIDPEPEQPKRQAEPEPEAQSAAIDFRALEELRDHYKREGEEYAQNLKSKAEKELARARADADNIREVAENQRMEKLRALEEDSAKAMEKAQRSGYETGYSEGLQKGTDDGYAEGLKKCRDALQDLKSICEGVEKEKAALMAENRRGIFDIAIAVAEKITMTVFEQKDKNVLEKMITEAAKEFRNAKSVRVSLSRHDLSEDVETDLKLFEKCFSSTVNVEFEVLDAEKGTLLLETDSEILDAGVSTQLKMIEELGKGKFRDREPESDTAEELEEAVKVEKPKKVKKAEAPKETEPVAKEETAESVAEAEAVMAEAAAAEAAVMTEAEPAMAEAEAAMAAVENTAEDTAEEQEATEEQ